MTDLIAMLKRKGLSGLIIEDSQEADNFAKAWMEGLAPIESIDPLVVSCLEIYQKAFNALGDSVNHPSRCALCEIEHLYKNQADDVWIDNVTDAVLATITLHQIPTTRIITKVGKNLH
jgi:hypothetical protein